MPKPHGPEAAFDRQKFLQENAQFIQEGEDPRILQRVGLTVFGRLKRPPSHGKEEENVAFLRERSSLVPAAPGWRLRTDHWHIFAPTAEWTSVEPDLPAPARDLVLEAMERQLGLPAQFFKGKMRRIMQNREYQHGLAPGPYHATHYAVIIKQAKAVRDFLQAIALPVSAGRIIAIGEHDSETKFAVNINQEIADLLDEGFARMQS